MPAVPNDGVPGQDVLLLGSIVNLNSAYSDDATPDYTWRVSTESGLQFDGVDDYVEIKGYKGVTGTAPRTIMAWIKTKSSSAIASWGKNSAGSKWTFRVIPAGVLRTEVNGGNIVGTTIVNDDEWYHVAAVLPDVENPDVVDVLLYVDGSVDVTGTPNSEAINTASSNDVTNFKY